MRSTGWRVMVGVIVLVVISSAVMGAPPTVDWPSFRGADAKGISDGYATATMWSIQPAKNIKWSVPIAGMAHSCPIVWQNRVFVLTAESAKSKQDLRVGLYGDIASVNENVEFNWKVICLDKNSGKVLWEQTAYKGIPKVKRHQKASHANITPATDGKRVVAFFGSEGLYCYDMDGKLQWSKDLGVLDSGYYRVPEAQWGFASSPILFEDKVIVQCDTQKNSFIAMFDAANGNEIWRTARKDVPTWSTPTVYRDAKRTQVIANGYKQIAGYDVASGKELWTLAGGGDIPVPTPVVSDGLIYITSAHGGPSPIFAIRTDASGDITLKGNDTSSDAIAWSMKRGGNYMQTPLVVGGYLYCCLDNGALSCFEAKTGKRLYRETLGSGHDGFTASGVAADGKLYFTSEEGEVHVVKAGPEFKLLATNKMEEPCMATPAISEGVLFFRTRTHLVAVTESGK